MKKLCFGSFATVLSICMNDVFDKKDLCDAMFSSAAPTTDFASTISDSLRTDIFKGRNPLPREVTLGILGRSPTDVADYFKQFVLPMLDGNKGALIVAAIKDILEEDTDITDVTEVECVNHSQKGSIRIQSTFVLHEFLAGIFIYTCRVKNTDLIKRVAEIDKEYIDSLAVIATEINLTDSYIALPPDLYDTSHAHELVLLAEANGRCMSCGRPVALETEYGDVDYCKIVHAKDNEGKELDLVLCVDCAREYANAPDEYVQKLLSKKAYHKIQLDTLGSISIPRQRKAIEEAIRKLASIHLPFDKELKYEPTKIENKIVDNDELRDTIIWNANYWFRVINTEIENAAEAGALRPERFSRAFSSMYSQARQATDKQEIIYGALVDKLADLIGHEYRNQCECIVSYFVQSCEVFDEAAK